MGGSLAFREAGGHRGGQPQPALSTALETERLLELRRLRECCWGARSFRRGAWGRWAAPSPARRKQAREPRSKHARGQEGRGAHAAPGLPAALPAVLRPSGVSGRAPRPRGSPGLCCRPLLPRAHHTRRAAGTAGPVPGLHLLHLPAVVVRRAGLRLPVRRHPSLRDTRAAAAGASEGAARGEEAGKKLTQQHATQTGMRTVHQARTQCAQTCTPCRHSPHTAYAPHCICPRTRAPPSLSSAHSSARTPVRTQQHPRTQAPLKHAAHTSRAGGKQKDSCQPWSGDCLWVMGSDFQFLPRLSHILQIFDNDWLPDIHEEENTQIMCVSSRNLP